MKTIEEINVQIDLADEDKYPGMSYSDGVKAALEWVLEYIDEQPMD